MLLKTQSEILATFRGVSDTLRRDLSQKECQDEFRRDFLNPVKREHDGMLRNLLRARIGLGANSRPVITNEIWQEYSITI